MIGNDWDNILSIVWNSEGYKKFYKIIENEYNTKTIYPPKDYIFNALKLTPYSNTKVVIVGQDPYHGEGEAEGLSFSVPLNIRKPPSLVNIFKELHDDLGYPVPSHGSLHSWAHEGVLLLNAVLTVVKDHAASHQGMGWETFTDAVISTLSREREGLVFMLWGAPAGKKASLIDAGKHCILRSAHPSPLSAYRGFFGNNHFVLCNQYLQQHGQQPIQW